MREINPHEIYTRICDILVLLDVYKRTKDKRRLEEIEHIAKEVLNLL